VIGWTRSPSGLSAENAGGVCVCGTDGTSATADAAAVEWRKLRREIGVMDLKDERRGKRSQRGNETKEK
jgi:hypothetical protein